SITGTKIFISGGEQDMTDNIIHTVLARLEGAPEGTKGISLFVVPKFMVNEDGSLGERNAVHCGSIEKKMGIKGSATCVMNFDGATGYLLGEPNRGLPAMFPMMNLARIGTGQQGQCHAEFGLQQSLAYARERLQSRSLNGPKNPDDPADPIIVHPDVRRMLLTQKAFAEGGRMLIAYCGQLSDQLAASDDPAVIEAANNKLSLLTPVVKAFLTEVGFESANLGMQCFGGHGYVKEWGVEQNVRDARISMLYEGTTGVQSLDLLGRKVLGSKLELLKGFTVEIQQFVEANAANPLVQKFMGYAKTLQDSTALVAERAMKDRDEIGAASVDYLMMVGYLALGYLWAQAALLAEKKLSEGTTETDFYQAKIKTATFYFDRILTRIETHAANIRSGAGNLMSIPEEQF
ncbi:MAG: acyl-CoA dehydrogenase C-terminal domain-containing protein, partial [bacterium]